MSRNMIDCGFLNKHLLEEVFKFNIFVIILFSRPLHLLSMLVVAAIVSPQVVWFRLIDTAVCSDSTTPVYIYSSPGTNFNH